MTPLNIRRLVPIGLAIVLVLFTFIPANAQSGVDTACTIPLLGGSCQFQCVKDKHAVGTVSGALAGVTLNCPESGTSSCNTLVLSCTSSNLKVKEHAVGTCSTSGTFIHRASCNGSA